MKVESFFTVDEINTARKHGATVQRLKWNMICLTFPSTDAYNLWLIEQKTNHPQRWINSFSIRQKLVHS